VSSEIVTRDGILGGLGKPPRRRVNNPPQAASLPYKLAFIEWEG